MKATKRFLIVLGFIVLALPPFARSLDLDGGGISDVWEATYATGPLVSTEDSDADGFSNFLEYCFNSNPLAFNTGYTQTAHNLTTNELEFAFYTPPGQRFQIQRTTDLASWSNLGNVIVGDSSVHIYTEDITGIQKAFFRAKGFGALDSDGDLLDAFEEQLIGTSDLTASSDPDNMTDGWEWRYHLNPLVDDGGIDADDDGSTNAQEFVAQTNPTENVFPVPYSTSFESSEGYTLAALLGQKGWRDSTSSSMVQGTEAATGGQAVELAAYGSSMLRRFYTLKPTVTTQTKVKLPSTGTFAPNADQMPGSGAALVSYDPSQGLMVFDGNGNGGGTWTVVSGTQLSGQWVTISITQNYSTHKWSLAVNGTPKLSNLGFKNNIVSRYRGTAIVNFLANKTWVDDFSVVAIP